MADMTGKRATQSIHCLLCWLLLAVCLPLDAQPSSRLPQEQAAEATEQQAQQSEQDEKLDPEQQARLAELSRELQTRLGAIEDLQSEQGIYHPALIEAYADIARLHVELEDYDEATRALGEALQIARINTGLYSEQQLPLIDELISNNVRRQDWQEVDDLVHLDHHIASRVYDQQDAAYLAAADDYGQWKLRVLRENLLQLNSAGLMNTAEDLSTFYDRLLFNVEFANDVDPDDLLRLLFGKSQADLSLARTVARTPYTYFQGTASRYITRTRCRSVRNAAGQLVQQCVPVQVENPRYRQSQIDAKRFAVNRYNREVQKVIERMILVRDSNTSLNASERRQLDSQIASLQAESEAVRRLGYRSYAR